VSGAAAPAGKLHLRSEAELPLVRCHRPALEHAFQEILTNALQANPDDPVVTLSIEPGRDGGVRVTVRDNGPGFTAEAARQATEPFFTTRNTGVGLGLTVAEKVVEDHHGQLHVGPRSAKHDFDVEMWLPAAASLCTVRIGCTGVLGAGPRRAEREAMGLYTGTAQPFRYTEGSAS
jgi:signal transduction histidine kinase